MGRDRQRASWSTSQWATSTRTQPRPPKRFVKVEHQVGAVDRAGADVDLMRHVNSSVERR